MNATLRRLLDERAKAWSQVQDIRDRREREGRDLTTEEDETYNRGLDDVERLGIAIEREERALRLESVDFGEARFSGSRGGDGESVGDVADVAANYRNVWQSWVKRGQLDMTSEERATLRAGYSDYAGNPETRALAAGTGTAGGYMVPAAFRNDLIVAMKAFGGMLDLATVIHTDAGQTLPWPTVDDTSNVGAILGENVQITQQDVAFNTANIDAFMYTSKLVLVSWQLLNDSATDVEALLRRLLAERIGRIWNTHQTVGTGTSQPDGIVVGTPVGKQGAAGQTTTVTYDDLIDTMYSIDPAYMGLPDVGWMTSTSFLKGVLKLKDGNNLPLWQPSVQAGRPDTLLGYPVRINQDVPVPAASAKSAIFGSVREAYVIRIVNDFQMVRLGERYADFLQTGFFGFARMDSTMQNTAAVRAYQQSAT